MTVEVVSHISDLNTAYPAAGDNPAEGDDHIRNLKVALRTDFPNITGPVTATQAQLNAAGAGTNSGLVLLATASASASAAIDFTTGIDSTYEEYELHIINAAPASSTAQMYLRTSANAGVSFDSGASDYEYVTLSGGGTSSSVFSTTSSVLALGANSVSTTASLGGGCMVVKLYDPAGTSSNKRLTWSGFYASGAGAANQYMTEGAGSRLSTSAVNAVRFLFSTGNIASGKFKLYGVKKS